MNIFYNTFGELIDKNEHFTNNFKDSNFKIIEKKYKNRKNKNEIHSITKFKIPEINKKIILKTKNKQTKENDSSNEEEEAIKEKEKAETEASQINEDDETILLMFFLFIIFILTLGIIIGYSYCQYLK